MEVVARGVRRSEPCFRELHSEDVAQDVMMKCVKKIREFQGRSSFATWIHRITSNCITDKIREIVKAREKESDKDVEQLRDHEVERESVEREPVTDREVRYLRIAARP